MLRQIFRFCPRRSFSNSAVWKDAKKEVASTPKQEPQAPPPPQEPDAHTGVRIDFVPTEFDKFILVYSGKYKSKDEIPRRIGYDTIGTAKSKVRIKVANYLMIGTVLMLGFTVWRGKQGAATGDSIVARGLAQRKKILEDAGMKSD